MRGSLTLAVFLVGLIPFGMRAENSHDVALRVVFTSRFPIPSVEETIFSLPLVTEGIPINDLAIYPNGSIWPSQSDNRRTICLLWSLRHDRSSSGGENSRRHLKAVWRLRESDAQWILINEYSYPLLNFIGGSLPRILDLDVGLKR